MYLAGDPERIRANVTEAVGTDFNQKFGDYLLMTRLSRGLRTGPGVAAATQFPASDLDDGMSRSTCLRGSTHCLDDPARSLRIYVGFA